MKKTLLALAVMTAAGSANAAINVYDNNGVKVDLSGAAEVQYYKDYNPSDDAKIRLDDGDLAVNTTIAINENLNVISGMAFKYEETDVKNDELWVGFSSNQFGALTFGRQLLVSDDSGIGKDYELGSEGIDFVQTDGNEAIKYVYDNGMFYFGASGVLTESGKIANDKNNGGLDFNYDTSIVDGRVGFRTNGLDARVYLYKGEHVATNLFDKLVDVKGYNVEAEYQLGQIGLAASFGQLDYTNPRNRAQEINADVYQIAADYTIDKTTFAIGYNYFEQTKNTLKSKGDAYAVYANVTQKLHDNVKVYAEVGHTDAKFDVNGKAKDADFGYVAGMEVTF
ncbi:TPA: porin [Photobacterium damselae]